MERDCTHLHKRLHVRYLSRFLSVLPENMAEFDCTRLTLAFFSLSGLDILQALELFDSASKTRICDWICDLQVKPSQDGTKLCGFQGSYTLTVEGIGGMKVPCSQEYAMGHVAMTYTGLASLLILGDDLSRVDRAAIAKALIELQQPDGSYCAMNIGSENDVRFVYCAACICYIIDDWSGMNIPLAVEYIKNCLSYDYGFGQSPGVESHGGVSYCAIAALSLMGKLHTEFSSEEREKILFWLISRQESGFQGRPNKPVDSCYSFWVGAAIEILGHFDKIDWKENRRFIMATQNSLSGGISKWIHASPDPMHTYLGLGALSLMKEPDLNQVHAALNISQRAFQHLESLHQKWRGK